MNSIIQFLETASLARLGVALIHSVWQIALLALLFKIVLTAANRRAARTRYWSAMAFLLAALVVPAITFSILPDRFVAVESQALDVATLPGDFDDENTDTALPLLPQVLLSSQPAPLAASSTPSEIDTAGSTKPAAAAQPVWGAALTRLNSVALLCSPYATLFWFIGVLLFSFRPVTSLVRIFRLKSNGLSRLDEKFTSLVERLSQRLHLKRSVEIAKSTLVQVPTVVGFFKPLILLPASSLSGLTAAELEAILLHELAHLKRYDDVLVLFQSFVETLLFFHPAVWWFSSVASSERENCCDDLATKAIGSPAPLASALLSLANQNNLTAQSLSATGGNVTQRIRRLAVVAPAKTGASRWLSSLFSLLVIGLIVVYAGSANSSVAETTTSVSKNDPAVVGLSTKQPSPIYKQPIPTDDRQVNFAAFKKLQASLGEQHIGNWVVIAGGKAELYADADSLEAALTAASPKAQTAEQRLVFRFGIDDQDSELTMSPWRQGSSRWWQLGRSFRRDQKISISAVDGWFRGKKQLQTFDGKGQFNIGTPGKKASLTRKGVISGIHEPLTITESDARALGLERFAVPGFVTLAGRRGGFCSKAWCQVAIPELDINTHALTVIVPDAIVASDPPRNVADQGANLIAHPDYKKFWGQYVLRGRVTSYTSLGKKQQHAAAKYNFHQFEFRPGLQLFGNYKEEVEAEMQKAGRDDDKWMVTAEAAMLEEQLDSSLTNPGSECIFVLERKYAPQVVAGTIPVQLMHIASATPEMLKIATHATRYHPNASVGAPSIASIEQALRTGSKLPDLNAIMDAIPIENQVPNRRKGTLKPPRAITDVRPMPLPSTPLERSLALTTGGGNKSKDAIWQLSPAGSRILYAHRNGQIIVASLDGSNSLQITKNGRYPCWSPLGQRLLFSSHHGGVTQIYEIDVDGKNLKQLTKAPHGARRPAFSATGWMSFEEMHQQIGKSWPSDLILTKGEQRIKIINKEYITDYRWSDDGNKICIGTSGKINFYDLATKEMTTFNISDKDHQLYSHSLYDITWSPNGKKVASRIQFLGGRMIPFGGSADDTYMFGDKEVFVIGVDGSFEVINEKELPARKENWINREFSQARPTNIKIQDTWYRIQEARNSKLDSPNPMNPPATETMIEQLETVLGFSVPPQFRDSLLIHNGMNKWGLEIQKDEYVEQAFTPLSVKAIERQWLDDRRYQKEAEAEGDDYSKKPEWIPIFIESAEGEEQVYLDSTDGTVLHYHMAASDPHAIDSFRYPDYTTFLSVLEHHQQYV